MPLRRLGDAVPPVAEPRRTPLILVPGTPRAIPAMMSSDPSLTAKVLAAMLDILDNYLPPNPVINPPLPDPNLSLVSVTERSVGLGSRVGTDVRGPFALAALKGTRIEAVVRYQIWSDNPGDVDAATQDLAGRLLADREVLRAQGFLRLALKSTGTGESIPTVNDYWRESVDFEVLYEFPYVDSDDAQSLIASIPVNIDQELATTMAITDRMTRWDNEDTPPLLLRGPLGIARLTAIAFTPLTPSGAVTLTRTFDGATGPVTTHPDLAAFLAAVADPNNPASEAQVVFPSVGDFLDEFATTGNPITLGDWDEDLIPDDYDSLELTIAPPIKLRGIADRFEISYGAAAFDEVGVVYLSAK